MAGHHRPTTQARSAEVGARSPTAQGIALLCTPEPSHFHPPPPPPPPPIGRKVPANNSSSGISHNCSHLPPACLSTRSSWGSSQDLSQDPDLPSLYGLPLPSPSSSLCLLFLFFCFCSVCLWPCHEARGSSGARDGTCATAAIRAVAVTTWILSPPSH